MEEKDISNQKDVQFYGAAVTAWLNTSLEYDKSLITLSTAGIGLVVTLLTTVGASSLEALLLYAAALLSFALAIVSVLLTFIGNKNYIEEVIGNGKTEPDSYLAILDRVSATTFTVGVLFLALIGISSGINLYIERNQKMNEKTKKETDVVYAQDSFSAFAKLNVSNESFSKMANLKPPASSKPPVAPAVPAIPEPPQGQTPGK